MKGMTRMSRGFRGNDWFVFDPSTARISVGGKGFILLGLVGLIVVFVIWWKEILLFLLFVAFLALIVLGLYAIAKEKGLI